MTAVAEPVRLLVRAVQMGPRNLLRILYALVLLGAAEVGLRLMPLRPLAARWGVPLSLEPGSSLHRLEAPHWRLTPTEQRMLWAVRRVTPRLYGTERGCLRRSLVVGHLLRHRAPVLRIGVHAGGSSFAAHAWVEVDGVRVEDDNDGVVPFTRPAPPAAEA